MVNHCKEKKLKHFYLQKHTHFFGMTEKDSRNHASNVSKESMNKNETINPRPPSPPPFLLLHPTCLNSRHHTNLTTE